MLKMGSLYFLVVGLLAGLAATAQPARAADQVLQTSVDQRTVDQKLLPKGQWLHGLAWTDARGANVVTFAATDKAVKAKPSGQDAEHSRYLQIRHYAAGKLVREVNDKVERCAFDLTLDLLPGAFAVTDLDGDGQGEVTLAYKMGCRSDVSSLDLKLLLLEDGAKLILRGSTRVFDGQRHIGGAYKAEPAKASWPAAFFAHADKLWQGVVAEK